MKAAVTVKPGIDKEVGDWKAVYVEVYCQSQVTNHKPCFFLHSQLAMPFYLLHILLGMPA